MSIALPNEVFNFGYAPLGFLALVPLYAAILDAPGHRSAALLVGAFGALQHALSSYWLWFFKDFRFWTLGSTTIAYGIIYAVLGLYLSFFLKKAGRARPFAFALLWAVFEYQKSTGFLGYPWGLLPYSLTNCLPLLQVADITGVYGISWMLALCNAAVAELVIAAPAFGRRLRLSYIAAALAFVAAAGVYGFVRMSRPVPEKGRFEAVLVQQNADPWVAGEEASLAANISLARKALADGKGKPDLILFSETTLQRPYVDFRGFYAQRPRGDPLIPFIAETGTWLFTGAPEVLDWDSMAATNSVILIDPEGRQRASYAKVHPVPFAEAIPFWDVPAFKKFIQETVGLESGWVMGTEYKVFELPTRMGTLRFGAPICFEDAFSDVCREYFRNGADLLVNLTNDAWSKTHSAEIQHWAVARFRAIEFRRTLLRSTNAGLSCVMGPYGQFLERLPLFEATARRVEVPVYREDRPTAYALFGDWFARAAMLLSAAWSLILMVRGLPKGGRPHEHLRIPRVRGA